MKEVCAGKSYKITNQRREQKTTHGGMGSATNLWVITKFECI
jgi:hypothetical protein